jgi:hypothetical protein
MDLHLQQSLEVSVQFLPLILAGTFMPKISESLHCTKNFGRLPVLLHCCSRIRKQHMHTRTRLLL